MTKYVIDASVVLKWFPFGDEKDVITARKWLMDLVKSKAQLIAPTFLLIEVSNILSRKKHLNAKTVIAVINKIKDLPITFIDINQTDLGKLIEIMTKYSLSAYDSIYVYLAVKNECKVLTVDKPIAETKYGIYILDQV